MNGWMDGLIGKWWWTNGLKNGTGILWTDPWPQEYSSLTSELICVIKVYQIKSRGGLRRKVDPFSPAAFPSPRVKSKYCTSEKEIFLTTHERAFWTANKHRQTEADLILNRWRNWRIITLPLWNFHGTITNVGSDHKLSQNRFTHLKAFFSDLHHI